MVWAYGSSLVTNDNTIVTVNWEKFLVKILSLVQPMTKIKLTKFLMVEIFGTRITREMCTRRQPFWKLCSWLGSLLVLIRDVNSKLITWLVFQILKDCCQHVYQHKQSPCIQGGGGYHEKRPWWKVQSVLLTSCSTWKATFFLIESHSSPHEYIVNLMCNIRVYDGGEYSRD